RRIILWNVTAKRRTAGLAYTADYEISSEDCVVGILNRWGASENTFKHIKERHPYHYHPGFALVESENQEIANPILKELKVIIKKTKQKIVKLKSKLADIKPSFKKDGSARKNSAHVKLKEEISEHELVREHSQKVGMYFFWLLLFFCKTFLPIHGSKNILNHSFLNSG
ncbi:MAG: hypothetical protein D3913_04265, partial [Candidatus Electrothrix sp. LOE1_4_5]|nr:hypothetical protein [Candidatus Electrothrix gigas]